MTKKQIMDKAIEIADSNKLFGVKRFEYLAQVQNSERYNNAPETKPTLHEQLETEVHKILDQINSPEGFFSNRNSKKK